MVCPSWLVMVVMAHVCVPGFGSACWDNSICNDLSNKERILECIHVCMSVIQNEFPKLTSLKVNSEDDDVLLSILLNSVAPGDKTLEPRLRAHSNERRSYSMEHFRWGKPPARKRRPIKVFASSLEGGGSSEGSFPLQARRQLGSNEDDLSSDRQQTQGLARMMVSSKSNAPFSPQQRKDGTYRMSHFRWGSPPASKRNANFMKLGEEKPQGQLAKLFRNIVVKDLQRIMG
ncbi:pro-opiomelanocortin-like [Sphaeramia orbicularis]|uniref:Pro-opiomelanocortin-like n=1 Tax=Sphaeramia orbicularis TaxID=375764 RepID=A0A672ZN52_9TELE|nr:pro-opiomelanocortin-like [Sphaeramia orbicularis]